MTLFKRQVNITLNLTAQEARDFVAALAGQGM